MARFPLLLSATPGAGWQAAAQPADGYPSRPVRVIVPFAACGNADIVVRIYANALRSALGQPFIVENRPGAGGSIAMAELARARAHGYTLGHGKGGTLILVPLLQRQPAYDGRLAFAPISLNHLLEWVVIVHKDLPVQTLPELIALGRANPGHLSYGTEGVGGQAHLTVESMAHKVGMEALHLPYGGGAPVIQDLLAARLDFFFSGFSGVSAALPQHRCPAAAPRRIAPHYRIPGRDTAEPVARGSDRPGTGR